MVRIAFYKSRKRLFNRITCWWLRGPYSHCEIVFADGVSGSASFLDGGVRMKRIDFNPDHWDFIEIEGDEGAARQWFAEHDGDGYDLLGLVGFIARIVEGHKRRWVCSEGCMAALGYYQPWRFDPCSMAVALGAKL
jgi:hypothetical protein